jgi:arylsulfatase
MRRDEFQGRIGRYHWESEPWWPPRPAPPDGAPNVLFVILDDVGFAQLGCFGSDIATPTFDRLASGGLRFRNFHTTALCSPTRACVLTGRNHHTVGMGRITDLATGFPGYDGHIPPSCALLPAMLTPHGYAAYAVGKWHLLPEGEEHLGAPRDRWPLGQGFERYYGFFGGETHQNIPTIVSDNHYTQPPTSVDDGYHLSADLADQAIGFLQDLRHGDAAKPWFLYLATGACHSPHQAPADWIARYAGAFDDGWDAWRDATIARQKASGVLPAHAELSTRPPWVPAWTDLSTDERRVYARYMEAFAGFLSYTDAQIGRVIDHLEQTGELENTFVAVLSDNGASSEGGPVGSLNDARNWNGLPHSVEEALDRIDEIGGPTIHNNYPWGWTVAGNTPFRRWKRETHEGGIADPLIVHWPAGIGAEHRDGVRAQYVHAIDLVPTVLELIGIEAPTEVRGVEQQPIEGTSFAYALTDPDAPERHTTQYSEMFGCAALYQDGWKAVSFHPIHEAAPGLDHVRWELYDVRADPSECHDLADEHPDRLAAMVDAWWAEAEAHQVFPLDNRPFSDWVFGRTDLPEPADPYVVHPDRPPVPEASTPDVRNRAHTVTAEVTIGGRGGSGDAAEPPAGALCVQGSVLGGWSFHLLADGRLVYVHNLSNWRSFRVEAAVGDRLTPGSHRLAFTFEPAHDGEANVVRLLVDDEEIGSGPIARWTWARFSLTGAGLTAGWSPELSPAADDYEGAFRFTNDRDRLHRVVIETVGPPHLDPAAEAADAIARQ